MQMAWQPGDDPTTHPMWNRQVALEQNMLRTGADRYRAKVEKAHKKGRMTTLPPYRRLVRDWLPGIVDAIDEWISDARWARRGGIEHRALIYLEKTDRFLAAYIALRHMIDSLTGRHARDPVHLMAAIGTALEHEARMQAWEKQDPQLYYGVKRQLKRQHATSDHRRRVNINRFNKLVLVKSEWHEWPLWDRRQIGRALMEIVVQYTNKFEIADDPHHAIQRGSVFKKPKMMLVAKPELIQWLMKATDRAELMSPLYLPTLMPPKRWSNTREGAYYTKYVIPPQLIHFRAHQEEQQKGAAEEYDGVEMDKVYKALDVIQEVGWRVNGRVLDVAMSIWDSDLGLAGLPVKEPEPLPPYAPDNAEPEVIRLAKRARSQARARNARKVSEVIATDRTLHIAKRFRGDTFYFPHRIDFRGRMYPIPVDLQPQGRDFSRGLLTFAEGKPVGDQGAWIAIHLANQWGKHDGVAVDKLPFAGRIDWVYANTATWHAIAADPISSREWMDCDNPWQALAAIFDWVGFLTDGADYVSHLPIRIDGTCNGLQHLSAAMRDPVGGASVNLMPGDAPRDIYQDVADTLTGLLIEEAMAGEDGETVEKAQWWLDICNGKLPRGLTKRPVMILPYGGTREAFFKYIQDWIRENHPNVLQDDFKTLGQLSAYMKNHCWTAVSDRLPAAMALMKWIKDCARLAARENQPLFWTTPSGFVVRHFYGKMQARKIKTRINGEVFTVLHEHPTKTMDIEAQLRGISPNFIHSMDAAANTIALVKCQEAGITSVTSIHDAFGSLAADMGEICDIVREAFVEVHTHPVLMEFRERCHDVLAGHIEFREQASVADAAHRAERLLPPVPPMGSLDLNEVLFSTYFFG